MALPAGESKLKVARTANGYRLRMEGRGTMRESRAAQAFAMQSQPEGGGQVVFDLSACDYLDSTFQGCLLELQRAFGRGPDSRFSVANPSEKVRKLMHAAHVDRFITLTDRSPDPIGEEMVIPPEVLDSSDMMRHVMDCHRHLAEIGGPQQAAFQKIADNMARELERKESAPPQSGQSGPSPSSSPSTRPQ
jgi:anti-anti-sigma regulatory factor